MKINSFIISSVTVGALSLMAPAVAPVSVRAQVSASPERFSPLATGYLERARTMLDAGNFTGVIDQLKQLHTRDAVKNLSNKDKEEYVYLLAKAYYERGDNECLLLLRDFALSYPASPLALQAKLSIGDYYFFHHQWPEALTEYDDVDFNRLNRTQRPLYSYRRALTLIKTGHYQEARSALQGIAGNRQYADAYTFYTAYLDYIDGNYDKAYQLFSKVPKGEKGLEAQYYITQIDYSRGEYDKVINRAPGLLAELSDEELAPELNRITGLSFFKRDDYSKARSYLNRYMATTLSDPSPDAVYALGVADYNEGDYTPAAERFASLTDLGNDLSQSAWLYLGQCDVKQGNDDAAAMAFEKAARMDFDANVSETALFNYAAAITRGGKVPFSSSIDLLEGFLKAYPNSEYAPKIEEYLATAYYNERDYAKALASIERIKRPSANVLAAKQKVLYELGIEAMNNGKAQQAADYLTKSIQLASHDRNLANQAQIWLGDARYALGQYKQAETAYSTFIKGESNSSNRTLALYDLAYAQYMQEKYSEAAATFRKAIDANPTLPASLQADATVRMADCLYYTGNYTAAKDAYSKAMTLGTQDADYATYRHAVMLGLAGDINGKISELTSLQQRYPESKWLPNALLEKALTYEAMGNSAKAADAFNELASAYPRSAQARKAMINLALSYAKAGKMDKASETYKEIIRTWPSSEEASIANDDLKKYYSSIGSLGEYAAFLRTVPDARQLDANEMEQLAFDGAETAFAENAENISLLQNYIKDYPDGKYLAQALLDIAYAQRDAEKWEETVQTLSSLISRRPHSVQYPEALLMKAEILENELPDRKDEAADTYKALEKTAETDFMADAYAGVARTSASPRERIEYARKARNSSGVQADTAEAMSLIEAEALLAAGDDSAALSILRQLAANPAGEAGASAAVALGQYYLDQKDYKASETAMLDFTSNGTPHQVQLAKGFIILADAYSGQGNNALAKEYLQSLKDNYPGNEPEILNAISSRLKSLSK